MSKGRPRKIQSPKQLEAAWDAFNKKCDNHTAIVTAFDSKAGRFVTAEVRHRVAYTIEGFCKEIHLPKSDFYSIYAKDEAYKSIIEYIKTACEADMSEKFQTGEIPGQLAGLLLSRYGYSVKTENKNESRSEVKAEVMGSLDFSKLSNEELRELDVIINKCSPDESGET